MSSADAEYYDSVSAVDSDDSGWTDASAGLAYPGYAY